MDETTHLVTRSVTIETLSPITSFDPEAISAGVLGLSARVRGLREGSLRLEMHCRVR